MTDRSSGVPRRVVAGMMALTGALFFFAFLLEDVPAGSDVDWTGLPWVLILRYILAMGIGGALAGLVLAGLFGRRGVSGWILALIAGIVATLFAGLLGSAVGLLPDLLADGWRINDLIPIAFGLLVIPLSFAGQPVLPAIWLVLILATHIWARRLRR